MGSLAVLSVRFTVCIVLALGVVGCRDDSDVNAEPSGQINRPGDVGLPLDNPVSVEAFNIADRFLIKWFFLKDFDAAANLVHPNLRESWRPIIEDTEVARTCSFVQVEGSEPDAAGAVTARYALGGCMVTSPGGLTAVYIELTLTGGEGGPWINQIEFLR